MISAQTITKNSLYSLSSSVVQKLMTLAYFIIVARVFGPEDQGRYSAAIAFAALFSVFIDMGLSSALTREIARAPNRAREYLGQMFLLRIGLGVIVYGAIIVLSRAFGYSLELQRMIAVAGIAAVIDTVTTSCWFLIRGFRNLFYESIGSTCAVIVMIIGGVSALTFHLPVVALIYAVLAGSIANFLFVIATIFFKARIQLSLRPNWHIIRYLCVIALPFAGSAIFSRIYTFADVSILTRMAGEHAVGWYSAGNKLLLALNISPAALSAGLYPALSTYVISDTQRVAPTLAKALMFLSLVSLPLSVGVGVAAPSIVSLFYGSAYEPTVRILQVLSGGIFFSFFSYPLGALIAAQDRQHINTIIFGVAAFVSIAANVLFIPSFSSLGSAIAATVTMSVLAVASVIAVHSDVIPIARPLCDKIIRMTISAAGMGAVVFALQERGVLFGVVLFTAVCSYALFCFITRAVSKQEMSEIIAALARK